MNATLRSIMALVLVALMGLTSMAMASARMAPDPSGQMVLCIGSGSVVVYVDEDGQPVQAPHYCPECALGALASLDKPPVLAPHMLRFQRVRYAPEGLHHAHRVILSALARGPPVFTQA